MLFRICKNNVLGYSEGQAPIVYLVTSVARLAAEPNLSCVGASAHPTSNVVQFTVSLSELTQLVHWPTMRAKMWKATDAEPYRQLRRQAEVLVQHRVPWPVFAGIAVLNDDEKTWPLELRHAFDAALIDLSRYEAARAEIDARAARDIPFRMSRPVNPHQATTDTTVAAANRIMHGRDIVGFDCARLHDQEIDAITRDGLVPLSGELVHARVDRRVAAGDIPAAVGARLKARHSADCENRHSMIWFLFTRGPLRQEHDVRDLLGQWGGEALYRWHDEDEVIGPLLRRIGIPCIVEAHLPVERISRADEIGEMMRRGFLLRRGVSVDNGGELESYVCDAVEAARIASVHRLGEAGFEDLTVHRGWHGKLT